jgi:hypothetical protein
MINDHLDRTLTEATARVTRNWPGDLRAYTAVRSQIVELADQLTTGLGTQFPGKVSPLTESVADEELHVTMRALWEDQASWTRFYLMSAIADLDDTGDEGSWLQGYQEKIGEAIERYYGETMAERLTALLHDHVAIAIELVTAVKSCDAAELAAAKARWTHNADSIATLLADANPAWSMADLQRLMHTHLDQTLAEANAQLTGDWAGDLAAWDAIEANVLELADVLSAGIATQFPTGRR